MRDKIAVGLVITLTGALLGVLLARLAWVFANPLPNCGLMPGGRCPGRPGFLGYALVGAPCGSLLLAACAYALARSLR